MRKFFAIFLILACASIASARTVVVQSGGVPVAAGEAYLLYWDGECTGNSRTDAKLTAGTCGGITGTLSGAEIINTDESSYYLYANALNEYLGFTSSSITGIDPDEIYLRALVKKTGTTAENNELFELWTDTNNRFYGLVNGSNGQISVGHAGNGTLAFNAGNDESIETLQDGYWGVIEVKYSTTNSILDIRVCSTSGADCTTCSGSEPWDSADNNDGGHVGFADMTATPTNFIFGENTGGGARTNTLKMDAIEIRTYANAP